MGFKGMKKESQVKQGVTLNSSVIPGKIINFLQ